MFERGSKKHIAHAAALAASICAAGCGKSGAEQVVAAYLNQQSCDQRVQFILEPDHYRDALVSHYKGKASCVTDHEGIDASACASVAVGSYCSVTVAKVRDAYCVKRIAEREFKIDWPCSTGWNEKPLKAVKAEQPSAGAPVLMRVTAELNDYYPSGVSREKELSLRISDDTDTESVFMAHTRSVEGSGRQLTFENAEKLKKLLGDGKKHKVVVELAYLKTDANALPFVSWFFQEGWEAIPDERLDEMRREKLEAASKWLAPQQSDADKMAECCKALLDLPKATDLPTEVKFIASVQAQACSEAVPKVRSGDLSLVAAMRGIHDATRRSYEENEGKYPETCRRLGIP
jgi:hypothetical protein